MPLANKAGGIFYFDDSGVMKLSFSKYNRIIRHVT